jgi:SAM-dependent methyltransferase
MQKPPISETEIEARIAPHLDELLKLWWAEQGAIKTRDLALMASVLLFPREQALRVLDLCCGPGDAGRAVHGEFPNAHVDGIDRDAFLAAICRSVNRKKGIPGKTVVRDLTEQRWNSDLSGEYDVVATVNALHWFTPVDAGTLVREIHGLLRDGGVFLFAEPVFAESPFAAGFETWKAAQPPRYTREAWERFWSRATDVLGYDPVALWGPRPTGRLGDGGITVAGWIALLRSAGFGRCDVLLRDADQAIVAALR